VYKNQQEHDPSDLNRAREIASVDDPIPVGILYHNPAIPCYEDVRAITQLRTPGLIQRGIEAEFDKVTVWPQDDPAGGGLEPGTHKVSPQLNHAAD
jgi:2-oxoglutarate ferredoxin oxidoreductase subunit beta